MNSVCRSTFRLDRNQSVFKRTFQSNENWEAITSEDVCRMFVHSQTVAVVQETAVSEVQRQIGQLHSTLFSLTEVSLLPPAASLTWISSLALPASEAIAELLASGLGLKEESIVSRKFCSRKPSWTINAFG